MTLYIDGSNRITIQKQQQLIDDCVKQSSLQLDAEFVVHFKKSQAVLVEAVTNEPAPFWSLGAYIDFAMFDEHYGYYTNKVNIGLSRDPDFITQLHKGLSFVYGVLVQAYNVWLAQLKAGLRTKNDVFNMVEPGAGAGIFALKLLYILDNLDMNSPHLNEEQRENWQAFSTKLRLYLSDRSPLQVINIKNTLAKRGKELRDQSLLEKVHVECCALADVATPADFLMVQEVFDVLPIERIKFAKDGIKIAIVVPTIADPDNQNQILATWLLEHSELTEADLHGTRVLSGHQDQLNKITWLETFVSIDHFPEVKQQVTQFYDYYAKLAASEKDKTINIRRYLTESLAPCKHLRGAALIFDYGHTHKDTETDKNHQLYEIRLFPQDDSNSIEVQGMGLFGLFPGRTTIKQGYLLNPGKYDITANIDFSELLQHVDDQHAPVCYGPQAITASDHFLEIIRSMPYFSSDFINKKYLPAHKRECSHFTDPRFDLESPLVVSLRLFTNFIEADDSFKQLMVTDKEFAQQFKRHYRFGFGEHKVSKEQDEYCGFQPGFLIGKRF